VEIPSKGTHGLREVGLSMSTAVIQVPFELVQKWQEIVDVIAEIIHVPSALVMKVEPPNIKVFVSSVSNGNPYERDELAPLNTGLYCETVMKTRQSLLVPDALRDEEWKSNPDIKLGMISYLGFPVTWPDGQIFGTICVLDRKENSYSGLYRKLVLQCRDVLEADLRALARLSGELTRSEAYLEEAQRLITQGASAGGFPLARSFGQRKALEFLDTTSRFP
jgi:GAF domain-containing protein